jgi:chromosome segregation ATPase
MIKVTDTKVSQSMQSDLAATKASVEAVNKKLKDSMSAHIADLKARDAKLAEQEALNTALKQQKDLLVTDLAKAQESLKQGTSTQKDQDTRLVQLTKELEQAKAVAAGADSKAQTLMQNVQEEASKIKRESGAALVALQASQAKLEAEKAAALKAAADAAAALAALQAKWDALPKATP